MQKFAHWNQDVRLDYLLFDGLGHFEQQIDAGIQSIFMDLNRQLVLKYSKQRFYLVKVL